MSFARKVRRAAERRALKEARKLQRTADVASRTDEATATPAPVENTKQHCPSSHLKRNGSDAEFGTSTRTTERKAAPSETSVKPGVDSKVPENPRIKEAAARFTKEFQPATETEGLLVVEMASHWVRLLRYRSLETSLLSGDELCLAQMAAVHKFMNSAERSFYRALNTLRDMQKERRKTEAPIAASAQKPTGFVPPKCGSPSPEAVIPGSQKQPVTSDEEKRSPLSSNNLPEFNTRNSATRA